MCELSQTICTIPVIYSKMFEDLMITIENQYSCDYYKYAYLDKFYKQENLLKLVKKKIIKSTT